MPCGEMPRVRCPQCVKEGLKSRVFPMGSQRTQMHYAPYYDEDGFYHHHDRNTITTNHRCSNEHRWMVKSKRACPAPNCHEHMATSKIVMIKPAEDS